MKFKFLAKLGVLTFALSATSGVAQTTAQNTPREVETTLTNAAVRLAANAKLVSVGGTGWAKSSVNAAVFRTSSLVTFQDTQIAAYYDEQSRMILARRKLNSETWKIYVTPYKGAVQDAHNVISLGIDGQGFLHISWDLHNQKLRYVRSTKAINNADSALELTEILPMTGENEKSVTYPQFYTLPSGDLLFLYRDGSSGNGNAMLNRYDVEAQKWQVVQHPLIAGGGKRNAYLNNLAVDKEGGLHLSWVWRDSPDVATNHDICYAYSPDEGQSWQKSNGEKYALPITIENAEVAWPVPHNSELINQTSMTINAENRPVIATYWRAQNSEVPQYQVVWHDGKKWQHAQATQRTSPFRLSGGGTKRIPISRPLVIAGKNQEIYLIFRDEELGNGVTVAVSRTAAHDDWQNLALLNTNLGAWEPTHDPILWQRAQQLNLFVQHVGQGDAETLENLPPQEISVLQWTP